MSATDEQLHPDCARSGECHRAYHGPPPGCEGTCLRLADLRRSEADRCHSAYMRGWVHGASGESAETSPTGRRHSLSYAAGYSDGVYAFAEASRLRRLYLSGGASPAAMKVLLADAGATETKGSQR